MDIKKIGFATAVSLVIANMIGTGVFTSLGFQVIEIKSIFSVLMLWIIGGIVALCGALTYGEIGAAFPRSGGEYNYLSKLYHPSVGFLSGWVSATVGFAAPVALAAMALGNYSHKVFEGINPTYLALIVVVVITCIHATDLKLGGTFQRIMTFLKLLVIGVFIFFGLFHSPVHTIDIAPSGISWVEIFSPAFAVSLIYVSYAYSGWNAASYIAGEIDKPQKNLPKSLFIGTLVVMIIYVLLNFVFLYSVPIPELSGYVEVGYLSAIKIFGAAIGNFMGLVISFLLVSSISAMIMAGPRIVNAMGEDMPLLRFLSVKNKRDVPFVAVIFQSLITVVLILTSKFEAVLTFVGFSLTIFPFLTVLGVFILRMKHKDLITNYKTWAYPITPLLFLALTGWTMYYVITNKTEESLYGLLNVAVGGVVWLVGNALSKKKK